ncbi:hypothetical protein ACF059_10075 [Streptomyces sp. NPDC016562]|uniref:hypothetical protein n=1 Tax=Streptomyces sp. NPDC016562 TaxID=3364966 RepID=UPI003700EB6A
MTTNSSVPEAVARLKIRRSALYDLLRTRRLASLTIGRARRIRTHALKGLRPAPPGRDRPMTASKYRKARANGEGTINQRKDGRWEAAGYVLAADGSRKRVRVYGTTGREAADKLTEKIADSNRGLPVASADSTVGNYLTYWLNGVAVHRLRENTHTRYATCVRLHLIPGLGTNKVARLTPKDVAPSSTASVLPANAAPRGWMRNGRGAARSASAARSGCRS